MEGEIYKQVRELQRQRKYPEALELLRKGCETEGSCCFFMGDLCRYRTGYWGLPGSSSKMWFKKGAALGHERCIRELQHDVFITSDVYYSKNYDDLKNGMNNGDDFCAERLAQLISYEEKNLYVEILKRGCELGSIYCHVFISYYLEDRDEHEQVIKYASIAAEQGDPYAMEMLVFAFRATGKHTAALYWMKKISSLKTHLNIYSDIMKESIYIGIERCEYTSFLLIGKYRETGLPKDVVHLIAKAVWNTRYEECWSENPKNKRIKK
jgi:TPR repeat protein